MSHSVAGNLSRQAVGNAPKQLLGRSFGKDRAWPPQSTPKHLERDAIVVSSVCAQARSRTSCFGTPLSSTGASRAALRLPSAATPLGLSQWQRQRQQQRLRLVPTEALQAVAAPTAGSHAPGQGQAGGSGAGASPSRAGSKRTSPVVLFETRFEDVGLAARAERQGGSFKVVLQLDSPRAMTLHWALDDWLPAPEASWPAGVSTVRVDDKACQSPFPPDGRLEIGFTQDACPHRVVFVLKQTEGGAEVWFNNAGGNYAVQLLAPPIESFVDKVLTAEGSCSHWSLPQRLMLATEVLDAADAAGPEGMSFLFTWLRLSSTRVLDWYRKSNFQPKDIAAIQKHAGERIAEKARSSPHPLSRLLARGALAGLPRGGGNGDDIRMGILHIMRGHGIREGHRPGHDEPFLEQWHQKLHTNTSPDDVTICEAYLAFLHSGNHDDYWRVLWDNGRLTRDKMESWSKPISAWPQHLPHLIPAFQGYLWTLKTTHAGADLDTAMEMAKGFMDDDLRWVIYDILAHRNDWWVPGKIVEARQRLAAYWKAPGSSRDLLLLDIALEGWFRTCLERTDLGQLGRDDLLELIGLCLRGAAITHEEEDLLQCGALWERLRSGGGSGHPPLPGERWGREWALAALAAAERLQLSVAAHMDRLYGLVQPHAESFGSSCRLDPAHVTNFGEEVVRGQPLFVASLLLQRLEPVLRAAAGGAPWQIVSQAGSSAGAVGQVVAVAALSEVQGTSYDRPTVLLAGALSGVEDIPSGVVAVLTRSSTDVLSHLAIRARSQRTLLATCFDDGAWRAWQELAAAGAVAAAVVDPAVGAVMPAEPPPADAATATAAASAGGGAAPQVALQAPERTSAWALPESSFRSGLVGAKALNLATLRQRLAAATAAEAGGGGGGGEVIGVPTSVALPYGTFERVLAEERRNAAAAEAVGRLAAAAGEEAAAGRFPREELEQLRRVVAEELVAPRELVRQLAAVAAEQGLIPSADHWLASYDDAEARAAAAATGDDGASSSYDNDDAPAAAAASATSWPAVWSAVCRVWASKWTDRAWLSRRALRIGEGELFMSVLLQQVVPFRYSFVLHTSNPVTHTPGELLGEVVVGMGETLVGNYPGRAMGFTAPPTSAPLGAGGQSQPQLISLPSKRLSLHAPSGPDGALSPTLIARSDANAEDLEQYAAAGLYDSVTLQPLVARSPDYATDPLLGDPAWRGALLGRLAALGRTVAAAFGGRDQDVEGGLTEEGRLVVVQARPQVEIHSPHP
ncbi:Phosphoglucan, water dikinase, chloroplastic [Pleodorina starrii]|uniref:Phosphoglucan, water dikinase, chloroplastic n=1 Tax=Pleodorina starrii TaxID=330485 RepID=A0A9W6BHP7_9CHLO|nr:Phosphoglucan, water dikinase, chloroplastic [Pleodorina starrii]